VWLACQPFLRVGAWAELLKDTRSVSYERGTPVRGRCWGIWGGVIGEYGGGLPASPFFGWERVSLSSSTHASSSNKKAFVDSEVWVAASSAFMSCRGFVFKAHRILYHSTLGLRVIKKKKNIRCVGVYGVGEREAVTPRNKAREREVTSPSRSTPPYSGLCSGYVIKSRGFSSRLRRRGAAIPWGGLLRAARSCPAEEIS